MLNETRNVCPHPLSCNTAFSSSHELCACVSVYGTVVTGRSSTLACLSKRWREKVIETERERENPLWLQQTFILHALSSNTAFLKVQTPGSDSYILIYSSSIFPSWFHIISSIPSLLPPQLFLYLSLHSNLKIIAPITLC